MALHFYHPHLQANIENMVHPCDACQRYRLRLIKEQYGDVAPERNAPAVAQQWQEVAVDCIRPWAINLLYGQELKFKALMSIQTVSNFPKIIRTNNKTSLLELLHVPLQFENLSVACTISKSSMIHIQ